MIYWQYLKIAFKTQLMNKSRTALTVLGIVIGIASIIIVYSAGEGIRSLVVGQIESFGTDIIETEIKVPSKKTGTAGDSNSASAIAQGVQITTLTLDDMDAVQRDIPNIIESYAGLQGQELISYDNIARKGFMFGYSAGYDAIDSSQIAQGRFFTNEEDKALANVVVLGSKMKEKLFGDSDAVDRFIRIRKGKFRVIGVFASRGATMGMDLDDIAIVPIRTMQKKILGVDHVYYIVHQLKDLSQADDSAEQARLILRERHEITDPEKDDFRIVTMQEMMSTLDTITGAITLLLLAIVAISLVVGGVGVLNIMYVLVTERTAEIGLRKAVGAKYNDIMIQFLMESVATTLLGGLIGIAFGVLVSYLISLGANSFGYNWKFIIPMQSLIVSAIFSFVFGIGFGLYPARKAARLDPIVALRNE